MTDRLAIHHIAFRAPCGVFPEERALLVDFWADVTLELDLAPAAQADDLTRTVDYGAAAALVVDTAKKMERLLVERLAEDIAQALLSAFPAVGRATVALTKPRPPVDHIGGGITVTISRGRA